MKLIIDVPQTMIDELRDGCFGVKHNIYELAGLIMNGTILEQEPKTGQWEWVQYDSNPNIGNWHCSECRTIIPDMPEETDHTPIYKWCPMCGAKMSEIPTGEEGSEE